MTRTTECSSQFPLFLMGFLTRPCRSGRIGCTPDRSCPVTEQPGCLVPHSCWLPASVIDRLPVARQATAAWFRAGALWRLSCRRLQRTGWLSEPAVSCCRWNGRSESSNDRRRHSWRCDLLLLSLWRRTWSAAVVVAVAGELLRTQSVVLMQTTCDLQCNLCNALVNTYKDICSSTSETYKCIVRDFFVERCPPRKFH